MHKRLRLLLFVSIFFCNITSAMLDDSADTMSEINEALMRQFQRRYAHQLQMRSDPRYIGALMGTTGAAIALYANADSPEISGIGYPLLMLSCAMFACAMFAYIDLPKPLLLSESITEFGWVHFQDQITRGTYRLTDRQKQQALEVYTGAVQAQNARRAQPYRKEAEKYLRVAGDIEGEQLNALRAHPWARGAE